MASAPETEQPTIEPPKKGALAALLPVVLALVGGLAAGGAGGAFVVGPALAKGITPATVVASAPKSDHDGEDGEEGAAAEGEEGADGEKEGEEGKAATAVYTIENLVLNPAESGGSRFLLLTIAFEAKDQAVADELKARDAELRDAVLVTLGSKSVEMLADMTMRDSLKAELRTTAGKLFKKKKAIQRIYFPQFVIQ